MDLLAEPVAWSRAVTLCPIHLAAVTDILQGVVMGLFILTAFILTVVVLLQEGKGGGIAGAFGGAGAEAFGVKAGTVNRFTAYVGTAFLLLALVHASITRLIEQPTNPDQPSKVAPGDLLPGTDGTSPIEVTPGGGTPPGAPPSTPPAAPPATPPATPPDGAKPPEPATPPVESPSAPPAPGPAPEQPKEPAPPAMGG